MKDEILEYLRKHVTTWPDDADGVWLNRASKIEFDTDVMFDFYPDEPFDGEFKAAEGYSECSETYNREQFETDLTKLDKPFGKLDRATQLKLVEYVLNGGRLEKLRAEGEWLRDVPSGVLSLHPLNTYRAIQS